MNLKQLFIQEEKKYLRYWPVVALYLGAFILALITSQSGAHNHMHIHTAAPWMGHFMGWILISFGLLKIEDVPSFAQGFRQYDLFARKSDLYAHAYPGLEVVLGAFFLLGVFVIPATWVTLVVYLSTAAGLASALHRGVQIDCLCLGSRFKLPLSVIAVFESAVMIVMALWMFTM